MNTVQRDIGRFAGGAGFVAATCAALCCAGAPVILSVLAATGLGFLRNDAILLPVIGIALIVALWGFSRSRRIHGSLGPFVIGVVGSAALIAGVVVFHHLTSKLFIGAGATLLLVATIWNARLPQACALPPAN